MAIHKAQNLAKINSQVVHKRNPQALDNSCGEPVGNLGRTRG
jgi:hypothetical protein